MNTVFVPLLRHAWWVVTALLLGIFLLAIGAKNLTFNSDYRVFFSEQNPQLLAFERMQQTFAKSDNVLFLLVPDSGDVFNGDSLKAIYELTTESWQLPFSTRVDSITNFQHTYAEEDDMIVEDLLLEPELLNDEEEIQRIKKVALQEPLLINRLIAPDSEVAGINVTFTLPGKNLVEEVPEVTKAAKQLAAQIEAKYPGHKIYLSGMVIMDSTFSEAAQHDATVLIPLMFALVMLLVGILIRTIAGTLATLIIIVLSIIGALGGAGWIGIDLTAPSASAPTMILTLAVADCVHILTSFYHALRTGYAKQAALMESLKINYRPVILTSVTTAIGFLSMNFSDSPPFRDLGNIVAVGVMLACLLSLTLFPALLAILPARAGRPQQEQHPLLIAFSNFIGRHTRAIFWFFTILVIAMVSQIPKNQLNDNFVEYFDKSIPFRIAADYSDENLTGMAVLEYELDSQEENGINSPAFLQATEAFTQWLRAQPEVIHVNSYTDIIKRLNMNMHADDESYYRLPDSRNLAAQYLLLYEMSLPYGLDLNNQINVAKSATRIIVNLETLSSVDLIEVEERSMKWLQSNLPELQAHISSPSLMFCHIGQRNIVSMLIGTSVALVLISMILAIVLRSVKYGLISLIPNLAPAAVAFGIWGMLVGEVGLALSVVSGMTLGIVVDDTVHFLSKYLHARRDKGFSADEATCYAFDTVGRALVITTVVLACGFIVLAQSSFKVNGDMGLLTAVTIVIALITDFFLLPALLLLADRKRKTQGVNHGS